jgi:hypothetical protein
MDTLLSGAKHSVRARAGPVCKAARLSLAHLTDLLNKYFVPQFVAPVMFRTLLRLLIEYHTLCSYSCFCQLRAWNFQWVGTDIIITL